MAQLTIPKPLYNEKDACRECETQERESTGPEPYRSPYRRDYARLIHCAAFRRLQGKTQVFPTDESDFFRNRLTHSLEVAQIAKSITLRLNHQNAYFQQRQIDLDIVEAASLAHDLGHPPFGHNGEMALDDCMRPHGGFEGNAQTFHILVRTEKKELLGDAISPVSPDGSDLRAGLNWSYRSLAAVIKYDAEIPLIRRENEPLKKGIYACDSEIFQRTKVAVCQKRASDGTFKTIETWIMDIADDIAYSTYDLEDTFKSGFLDPLAILGFDPKIIERVAKKVSDTLRVDFTVVDVLNVLFEVFENMATATVERGMSDAESDTPSGRLIHAIETANASSRLAADGYLRTQFTADLVSEFLGGVEVAVDEDYPQMSKAFLNEETLKKVECLKHFTFESTIMAPRLRISENRGYDIVKKLFERLSAPKGYLLMPDDFRSLYESFCDEAKRKRVICDFIAGMTDRYAVEFYGRLFSENPQSIFKPF